MNGILALILCPTCLGYSRKLGLLAVCICLALSTGCRKSSDVSQGGSVGHANSSGQGGGVQTGPGAETIVRDLIARYSSANSYSDNAVLYLTYLIHGQRIQEPQPWSTSFVRASSPGTTGGQSRLASKLFNGQVVCDRNLLSCYVYDIESANLNNQHLLIPYENQLPISQLYRDSIARHFIAGYSELPLDETDLVSTPKLIPAPISLLTNQVRNGWLQNPTQVQRLADQTVDEKACYVVRCLAQGMTADIWVEKRSSTLVQMSLPLKLLDPAVIVAPEITDVVLLARFHEAKLDTQVAPDKFALRTYNDATPVRKFVQLPENFPSDLIGEVAPDFEVLTQEKKSLRRLSFDGKVTALLWVSGRDSYHAIPMLSKVANDFSEDRFHFASIYTDSDLMPTRSGDPEPGPELKRIIGQAAIPTYYDPQLKASVKLGAKLIPSVIVLDGDSKIQYARALGDKKWPGELAAVMKRVAKGEDVAGEMQDDYVRYLESYHQQLVTVSAADLIGKPKPGTVATVSTNYKRSAIRMRPAKTWVNSNFKKPGNIAVIGATDRREIQSGPAYVIFDGWRTVAQLDAKGKTLDRVELKLPDGEAANLIRVGRRQDTGNPMFAVFSALGKRVFLFDHRWDPITSYPNSNLDHAGVRDCRLTDLDGDGKTELIVAFDDENGIHKVDPETGKGDQASKAIAMSVVSLGAEVVVAGQGKIGMLKNGLTNVEETELDFQRVASLGTQNLCGLGVTNTGNWNAVGFDTELKRSWTLSVGSQFFETDLEPISVSPIVSRTGSSSEVLWAIADTQDIIHLVSGAGKWLGDFQSQSRLHGLALESRNGSTNLIVCNQDGIECWNLNLQSGSGVPVRPASSQK